MSDLIAWGDESIQTQGAAPPAYYLGVCICTCEEVEVRRRLLPAVRKGVRKMHWRDMTPKEKRKSIQLIDALSIPHIVVEAAPLDGTIHPERARRKCLECLLRVLEQEYGVTRLVLEAREASQDRRDLECVMGFRRSHLINELRVDFAPGPSDARLWIPDQVLGLIGDMRRGSLSSALLPGRIDKRVVNLRQLM